MSKQSAFWREVQKEARRLLAKYQRISMQMGEDVAFYTAHDVLGLGPGRAEEFGNRYVENMNWVMGLILDDAKDDKEIEYAKELQDRRLRPIVGEKLFVPYNGRYRE